MGCLHLLLLDVPVLAPDVAQSSGNKGLEPLIHLHMHVGRLIVVGHVHQRDQIAPWLAVRVDGPEGVGFYLQRSARTQTRYFPMTCGYLQRCVPSCSDSGKR